MRKYISMILCFLVALSISSCGGDTGSAENAESAVEEKKNEPMTDMERLVGTYVGETGSGLTIYEDGTADNYNIMWTSVETGMPWTLEDDVVTVTSKKLGYDIFAELGTDEDTDLFFESKDVGWDDEKFMKKTSEPDSHYFNEYFDEERKKKTEMTLGDMTYTMPYYFTDRGNPAEIETSDDGYPVTTNIFSVAEDGKHAYMNLVIMTLDLSSESISQEQYEQVKDSMYSFDSVFNDFAQTGKKSVTVAENAADQIDFTLTDDGNTAKARSTYWYQADTGIWTQMVMIVTDEAERNYFKDYNQIIKSAKPANADEATDSKSDKQKVKKKSKKEKTDTEENTAENGVTPEFKEMMDSYEAFMDEYIEFMKKYQNSSGTISMLSDYADYMAKYADFTEKINAVDENELSVADQKYYLEVTTRVAQKLLEVNQ